MLLPHHTREPRSCQKRVKTMVTQGLALPRCFPGVVLTSSLGLVRVNLLQKKFNTVRVGGLRSDWAWLPLSVTAGCGALSSQHWAGCQRGQRTRLCACRVPLSPPPTPQSAFNLSILSFPRCPRGHHPLSAPVPRASRTEYMEEKRGKRLVVWYLDEEVSRFFPGLGGLTVRAQG